MADLNASLDALIAQYGSPDALAAAAKKRAIQATHDHFTGHLASIKLNVQDWRDLMLFLNEPNTSAFNATSVYEQELAAVEDAIKAQDAGAFLQAALMVIKALRDARR